MNMKIENYIPSFDEEKLVEEDIEGKEDQELNETLAEREKEMQTLTDDETFVKWLFAGHFNGMSFDKLKYKMTKTRICTTCQCECGVIQ